MSTQIRIWSTDHDIYLTRYGPRGGARHTILGPATEKTAQDLINQLTSLKLRANTVGIYSEEEP